MSARVRSGALTGAVVGLLVVVAFRLGWLERMEAAAVDLRFRLRPPLPATGQVVVIGITQKCIEDLGPTPWPRTRLAECIGELRRLEAAVIGLDIFFPLPSEDPKEDEALAEAMSKAGNVVLPVFDARRAGEGHLVQFRENTPRLAKAAAGQGHINVTRDPDGAVRRVPLEITSTARSFPVLGVAAATEYLKRVAPPRRDRDAALQVPPGALDEEGQIWVNWRPPGRAIGTLSFREVVHQQIPADRIRGKIVLVGQTAAGLPNADTVVTPYGPRYGVFVQADVIEGVLGHTYLRRGTPEVTALTVVAFSVLLSVVLSLVSARGAVAVAVVAAALMAGTACALFNAVGLIVNVAPLALTTVLALPSSLALSLQRARTDALRHERAVTALHAAGEHIAAVLEPAWSESPTPYGPLGIDRHFAASVALPVSAPGAVLALIAQSVGAQVAFFYPVAPGGTPFGPPVVYDAGTHGASDSVRRAVQQVRDRVLHHPAPLMVGPEGAAGRWCGVAAPNRAGRRASGSAAPPERHGLECPRHFGDWPRSLRAVLATPVSAGHGPVGVLVLGRLRTTRALGPGVFTPDDVRVAGAALPHLGLSLQSLRLQQRLHSVLRRSVGALVAAVEAKDRYTKGHSERVAAYAVRLSEAMRLGREALEAVELAALVHDVGKIGTGETILHKPGPLNADEWAIIRAHPRVGAAIFEPLQELSFLGPAIEHHHECYDGQGYPDRLAGSDIPLMARIIAIADAFDAMTSERPYRDTMKTFEEATAEVLRCAGTQFDPELAPLFAQTMGEDTQRPPQSGPRAKLGEEDRPAPVVPHRGEPGLEERVA